MSESPIRKLSVLIPVYNEIRTLERLLRSVAEAPLPCERELVVVDDGSTDGSREFLEAWAPQHPEVRLVLHERNQGKGAAIRTAIEHLTGDWAVIQDADLEYDPRDYQRLLVPVQAGLADAVFGSRFLTGEYRRAMFFWHTVANRVLTLASNVLNDLNLTDMETCYKLVRADILKSLHIRSRGFDLEPELTAKLARWGARIYEVPISYRGRTYAEGKKIGARDAVAAFVAMVRYRWFDVHYAKHDGFLILQSLRAARRFNRWLFGQIRPWVGQDVLEAGCGIGNLTEFMLDRRRLTCVDNERFYAERLRQTYGLMSNFSVHEADLSRREELEGIPGFGSFDTVVSINVVEHIERDAEALRAFHAALRPGGHALVLVPQGPQLYNRIDEALGHFRRYTPRSLAGLMEDAGFEVVRVWGFNRVGGLGWRLGGLSGGDTISPMQMRVFELLMPFIRLAERLPFHTHASVIAVGRRRD